VYAIPANAEQVLRINPRLREAKLVGPTLVGPQKWYGGLCASNGCIYGIPQNAGGVLKVVPCRDEHEEDQVLVLGEGVICEGEWKWHGKFDYIYMDSLCDFCFCIFYSLTRPVFVLADADD